MNYFGDRKHDLIYIFGRVPQTDRDVYSNFVRHTTLRRSPCQSRGLCIPVRWLQVGQAARRRLMPEEAYASARKEYVVRRDIYGAGALAWTAFEAGKLPEARFAMKEALRLGVKDAKLFFHAGMIAHASGDNVAARDFLNRALTINPQFDLLQTSIAQKALLAIH